MRRSTFMTQLSRKVYHHNSSLSTRFFTSTHTQKEKLRIAIVGGGASGLSTALHMAPLAERGIIAKPIDIYEKNSSSDVHPHEKTSVIDEHFHPGTGTVGRDIGVGIWSTALRPFATPSSPESHLNLIKRLEHFGHYVDKVGYRTPKGYWLTKSSLNSDRIHGNASNDPVDPSLLFIQEKDFLSSLREAVSVEEKNGTIRIHCAKSETDKSTTVDEIVLQKESEINHGHSGKLLFSDGSTTSQSYNFIVAADGMSSSLRLKYAGYKPFIKRWKQQKEAKSEYSVEWIKQQLEEKHAIEDRKYVVFRGNAPLTDQEANMDGVSFQTWGEGKNMRFAAVGMSHPNADDSDRCEKQVWFATICDEEICSTKDAEGRKKRLLASFKEWHDPICKLIESTPAEKIFMERGVGHKHSLLPVLNLAEVINYKSRSKKGDESLQTFSESPGPILLFIGDAYMTVDPVLAQGFTMGMEAAADLASTIESSLGQNDLQNSESDAVRNSLKERNKRRFDRVMCLIRSTELVQSMAQPNTTFCSNFSKYFVRPAMILTPSFVKEAAFSAVMKYSLGYYGDYTLTRKVTDSK